MLKIQEQKEITQLIADSSRILITTRGNPGFDDVATCLAWYSALKKQKKERVDVVMKLDPSTMNRFKFLPGFDGIQDQVHASEHFVIKVDASKTKVSELSYDMIDDTLEIHIRPENGNFAQSDVSFAESSFAYDLIVTLGVTEFASIGSLFENNRDLFFNTTVINIDRSSSNVRFGQVNAVYLVATSLAELSYPLLKSDLSTEVATCLLTGLIASTNSFQTPQVTPDTLQLASELIIAGASREEIVNRLYRNKDMAKLKLWGRVLSHLQQVDTKIVYSHLYKEEVGTGDIDLRGMVEELVLASPDAHIVLFFFQIDDDHTKVYAYARENYDLPLMFQKYEALGRRRQIEFTIPKDTTQAEVEILEHVKQQFKLINH